MILTNHDNTLGLDLAGCALHCCRFDYSAQPVLRLDTQELGTQHLPPSLLSAVPKRQAEFLAGRYCALRACRKLGHTVTDIPIHSDRSPIWPEGIVGSLTHAYKIAACIVTEDTNYRGLGLDIEQRVTTETLPALRNQVASQQEVDFLKETYDEQTAYTLLFSAKEAIYKAIYRSVNRFVDFREVVCFNLDANTLNFQLNDPLSSELAPLTELEVRFVVLGESITTLCMLPHQKMGEKSHIPL